MSALVGVLALLGFLAVVGALVYAAGEILRWSGR